jgi:hypothetical protein
MAGKMMHRVLILISFLTSALSLTAYPQAKPQQPQVEEPPPVLSVPKDYRYNARGRRDPFVNPVPKLPEEKAVVKPPSARPPGLKGVLVQEAQVAGVVTSREPAMNIVIISAPGAKTPYFAHVGDQLYDGVIKSIKLDTVTFTMTGPDGGNQRAAREIVRKVRPKPGEEK